MINLRLKQLSQKTPYHFYYFLIKINHGKKVLTIFKVIVEGENVTSDFIDAFDLEFL